MCNKDSNCIGDVLKVICVLQRNADCGEACLDTCDRGFLGFSPTTFNYNTRPISLYLCGSNSTPLAMPISKSPTETETSTVFRVEKCDDECATFRVLTPNYGGGSGGGRPRAAARGASCAAVGLAQVAARDRAAGLDRGARPARRHQAEPRRP